MDLFKLLEHHEGYRDKVYDDATGREVKPGGMLRGNLTIGVGHNLSALGLPRHILMQILEWDAQNAYNDLITSFRWVKNLDPVRQAVLTDMCFNMGSTTLKQFKNTLAAFERGDWPAAAKGMLSSLWAQQVGKRAVRLAAMVVSGEWPKDIE